MTKIIYIIIKFIVGVIALVFGFMGMAVIFVIALPLAGWNKSKYIFKRIPKQRTPSHSRKGKGNVPKMENPPPPPKKCICNDIEKQSPGGRCEACHSNKKDGGSDLSSFIGRPEFPKDRNKAHTILEILRGDY